MGVPLILTEAALPKMESEDLCTGSIFFAAYNDPAVFL